MASRTIHRKEYGAAYIYSVESYWDKEKKAPRNRQVCLGQLDEATGEIIPSTRKKRAVPLPPVVDASMPLPGDTITSQMVGPHVLLSGLAQQTGLSEILRQSMPQLHDEIMSLIFFIAQKGLPLSRCERWSESHTHPADHYISSQQVSKLLKRITEDDRQRFLSLWLKELMDNGYLCYDITFISSYAVSNEYVCRGYNRDGENLPQINLAMMYGQNSSLLAYYRRMPRNISDVSTLHTTVKSPDFLDAAICTLCSIVGSAARVISKHCVSAMPLCNHDTD